MSRSLYFKIKDSVDINKHRLLELFFKDWVDYTCANQVQYIVQRDIAKGWEPGMPYLHDIFRVDFENQEDAVFLRLKGVPQELCQYLEIID